jgi:hypothetical protein
VSTVGRLALAALAGLAACRDVVGYRRIALGDASTADASCGGAAPTVLFKTSRPIVSLVLSSSYVYAEVENPYSADAHGLQGAYAAFLGCPKAGCGGAPETLDDGTRLPAGSALGSVASSDAGLFYALDVADGGEPGELERVDADGGGAHVLVSHAGYPYLAIADDTSLYWTDDPEYLAGGVDGVAWSAKAAKLGASPLVPSLFMRGNAGQTYAAFLDNKNVYVVADDPEGSVGLFVCARLLADGTGGCGGAATELLTGLGEAGANPDACAADGEYAYRAAKKSGKILRTNLSTRAETTLATGQDMPQSLALGGSDLYWSTASGEIVGMPKDGSSPPVSRACAPAGVVTLATDEKDLYFVAASGAEFAVESVPLP